MIQRKQTIYLFLALVLAVVCLCLPVARFVAPVMGNDVTCYNLLLKHMNGMTDFVIFPFVLLLLVCLVTIKAIFSYKNRPFQARLCTINMVMIIVWYIGWGVLAYFFGGEKQMTFRPEIAAALPCVALIFTWLARRGVMADEKLVRSMDRIR